MGVIAYRFNGSSDYVQFAIGPASGYTVGPLTVAAFLKKNAAGTSQDVLTWTTNVPGTRLRKFFQSTNVMRWAGSGNINGPTLASTSVWYIIVLTRGSGTVTPRWHVWDGSTWSHTNGSATSADLTIASTDVLRVGKLDIGSPTSFLSADVVCCGYKKADTVDATVETLTATAFTSWTGFLFDWLIGFETASTLTNRTTPGSGDETSRSGTSLVSDPGGWSWGAASTFVPRVISVT